MGLPLPLVCFFLLSLFSHPASADVRMVERIAASPILPPEHIALPDPLLKATTIASPSQPFFLMPSDGRVSSLFGWRTDPFEGGRRFHEGMDVANARQTRIVAVASGRVLFAGWASGCGWTAVVEHGGGIETRYCHLEALSVRPGELVPAGGVVGGMGGTGRATGTHLHFEVREDGRPIDPVPLLMF